MPKQKFNVQKAERPCLMAAGNGVAVICGLFLMHLFFLFSPCPVSAAEKGEKLIIGTKHSPPFVMKKSDGSWEGISVALWDKIALENGFSYEFREMELSDILKGVADNELDAGVAAITVTAEREETLDFSQPYYLSRFGIATLEEGVDWKNILKVFFSYGFFRIVVLLSLVLLLSGFLVWLFERRKNPEHFGGSPTHGIGSGFWWAAVTMTTVGYGDKSPKTPAGRVVALVWMFASLVMISGFTAAITTTLTVGSLGVSVTNPRDLHAVKTGTVEGSTSMQYLNEEYIAFQHFATIQDALQALQERRVEAVLYDEPIMRYMIASGKFQGIKVIETSFRYEYYAVALPPDSPRTEDINRSLLHYLESENWRSVQFRYLDVVP
ncbi:MAG: transporter substrate-binding domain-containing protein [Chlorobium phaeobacteroides]|uniref:Ion transport 2 domain protein n=1 Tax=Chlorobium phaeobacteroides (strain BS1) TaxID=331678 RepID=B3EN28_CHLPB|nr:transporter substrate-binding domain-containing protein [Chlorobium phaeobacteroides]MBL6955352.1 transporter substrate-binding domain-containing protein [Chlorobium phaeobacteroides]